MEDLMNNLTEYVALIGPILVSVVTMIATVITAIKKCASVANDGLAETKAIKTSVANTITQMSVLTSENAELKNTLNATLVNLTKQLQVITEENTLLKQEKEDIGELKAEVENLKETNKTLQAQIKQLQAE